MYGRGLLNSGTLPRNGANGGCRRIEAEDFDRCRPGCFDGLAGCLVGLGGCLVGLVVLFGGMDAILEASVS